uniref:Dorsal2 n=1 Tax=Harmonia axyridis TaxID=115357 RepID=A0A1X9ITP7_HARAX|nr:dorsal2 [Harmonia axyridis]
MNHLDLTLTTWLVVRDVKREYAHWKYHRTL